MLASISHDAVENVDASPRLCRRPEKSAPAPARPLKAVSGPAGQAQDDNSQSSPLFIICVDYCVINLYKSMLKYTSEK